MKTKLMWIKEGDAVQEVSFDKAVAAFAKANELKKAEAEEFIKDAIKGETYEYNGEDPAFDKAHKATVKAAAKFVEDSKKNKEALAEARLKEEKEAEKKKELIVKASEKGVMAIAKMEGNVVDMLQKAVGSDFVVDDHGLTLAKGVAVSPESVSQAISGINNGAEILTKARTTFLITLGDAVNVARKEWGEEEGDNLVAQAIPEDGQGKHMVLQSSAVMSYVDSLYDDHKDRPVGPNGLSFTHLQEAKNYGRNKDGTNAIPPAKVKKILEKAVEEKLSCADMRDLLKKARPDKEPGPNGDGEGEGEGEGEKGSKATEAKALYGYLITDYDSGDDYFEEELREDLLTAKAADGTPAYKVIDLAALAILKPSGKVASKIGPAPALVEA